MRTSSKWMGGILVTVCMACGTSDAGNAKGTGATESALKLHHTGVCEAQCNPLDFIEGNEGTGLCATATARCIDGTILLQGTLTTSGSVDSAVVALEDGSTLEIGVIQPQDFVHHRRFKTACFSFEVDASQLEGLNVDEVCFTQSGAQGRLSKRTCVPITLPECETDHHKPDAGCDHHKTW